MLSGSSAILDRECIIFVNFDPQKPKIGRIGLHTGHGHPYVRITVEMRPRKRHARDAPFMEYRAVCERRIGMCGYKYVPSDVIVK